MKARVVIEKAKAAGTAKPKEPQYKFSAEMLRLADLWRRTPGRDNREANTRFIHVEPHRSGGAYVLGTDGAAMFVGYDRQAKCPKAANLCLPPSLDKEALIGNTTLSRTVEGTRDSMTISEGDFKQAHHYAWVLPDMWPDWRRILPTEDEFNKALPFSPRVLSAEYLKRIGMMYDSMGEHREVHFCTRGMNSSVLVMFPWNPDMFLVVMPFKGEDIRHEYPRWLPADDAEGL